MIDTAIMAIVVIVLSFTVFPDVIRWIIKAASHLEWGWKFFAIFFVIYWAFNDLYYGLRNRFLQEKARIEKSIGQKIPTLPTALAILLISSIIYSLS